QIANSVTPRHDLGVDGAPEPRQERVLFNPFPPRHQTVIRAGNAGAVSGWPANSGTRVRINEILNSCSNSLPHFLTRRSLTNKADVAMKKTISVLMLMAGSMFGAETITGLLMDASCSTITSSAKAGRDSTS